MRISRRHLRRLIAEAKEEAEAEKEEGSETDSEAEVLEIDPEELESSGVPLDIEIEDEPSLSNPTLDIDAMSGRQVYDAILGMLQDAVPGQADPLEMMGALDAPEGLAESRSRGRRSSHNRVRRRPSKVWRG